MNRMQSLLAMLQQAESARDTAHLEHRRAEAEYGIGVGQATQLIEYRLDNERRYRTQFAQGSSIEIVRHYQSFMQRLTQAIEHQERVVKQLQKRVDAAHDALQQCELQVASIRKLIERRAREQREREERREQFQSDEAATRAALRKPSMFAAFGGVA